MAADFLAGYASGALATIIGNPLDLIKVRLQASSKLPATSSPQTAPYTSPHTIREALRGLPAPVLTYGALNALLFTSYHGSLDLFSSSTPDITGDAVDPRHAYWTHFFAGAIAGLAIFVISTPTELIKCRAQMISETASSAVSSWSIAQQTLRRSGIQGLYEGGVVTSLRDAVGYGFYFCAYEASKDLWDGTMGKNTGGHESWLRSEVAKTLLCGGVSGVATWASIFPLDVIKTRVQTQQALLAPQLGTSIASTSSSSLQAEREPLTATMLRASNSRTQPKKSALIIAKEAYRTEGMNVFFRGMTICCVRAFIVNAVQWFAYEALMKFANS